MLSRSFDYNNTFVLNGQGIICIPIGNLQFSVRMAHELRVLGNTGAEVGRWKDFSVKQRS